LLTKAERKALREVTVLDPRDERLLLRVIKAEQKYEASRA